VSLTTEPLTHPGGAELEQRAVNVIRGLAMDAPEQAHCGHPGTAMALAPLAHVLFTRVMRYDAGDPGWFDRDRFILSNGHACILQYAMLHLTGFGLELEDLRQFRQFGSITPGHPEVHHTPGIEVTTGPLGQGFAQAVGVAMAEQVLRRRFGPGLCDHHVYGICGDGDLMEGVSHEAASLAGHLGLGRLIFVYDDNHITIDGATELAMTDDAVRRFESYGWQVVQVGDAANDLDAIEAGLREAKADAERPSLVVLRSHIGWPSPHRTDTKEAHGDPLGADEVRLTKGLLGLPIDEPFFVPDDVLAYYREAGRRGRADREAWGARHDGLGPDEQAAFAAALAGRGEAGWAEDLPSYAAGTRIATRKAVNEVLSATAPRIGSLVVGSADLTGNTGTKLDLDDAMSRSNPGGRQVHFGIREFAMVSALNGMALHGGVLPVGGTFFAFSDYCRPAIRLGAMSNAHAIVFFTHDSIGLGEDGPTHQPIEQLASLRAMPGLRVIRPADANECAAAWRVAVESDGMTLLILTRQEVPVLEQTAELAGTGVARGAYVLAPEPGGAPDVVLVGTGSEVQHCVGARELLGADGIAARVVSLPSWDLFEAAGEEYRRAVLPPGVPRLGVEAASSFGWERYADATVAIDRFGSSAPGGRNMAEFGFTADNVAQRAREMLGAHAKEAL
jgi:transketolase